MEARSLVHVRNEVQMWTEPIGGNVFCDSFERNISPPATVGGLMDKTIRPDARISRIAWNPVTDQSG